MTRIGFMTRLSPENHAWLGERAKEEERSMTSMLDRIVSAARKDDQARQKENAPELGPSEALDAK